MLDLLPEFDTRCFPTDYQSARRQFLSVISKYLPKDGNRVQSFSHPLSGPSGEELACDVACLGNAESPDQLLVLMSSTHGVEGFAGSAIQVDCLPHLKAALEVNHSLGVIIIHAINPWGFAWLRRYDHEGIDINRNFADFSRPLPEDRAYEALHTVISNTDLLSHTDLSFLWSTMGLTAFSDVVTTGQYSYPDGCFFGGNALSWSRQVLEQLTQHVMVENAKRIAVIDLHTGLGSYGYGEIINDHLPDTAGFRLVERLYGANAKSALLGESCSSVKTGLVDYHWHQVMGDRGCFVTLEFGTYSLEQLLTTLIKEQLYQNTLRDSASMRDITDNTVQELKRFFYPVEKSWQQQVLFRGRQVISMALNGLMNE